MFYFHILNAHKVMTTLILVMFVWLKLTQLLPSNCFVNIYLEICVYVCVCVCVQMLMFSLSLFAACKLLVQCRLPAQAHSIEFFIALHL
jgi:hypothetical protein